MNMTVWKKRLWNCMKMTFTLIVKDSVTKEMLGNLQERLDTKKNEEYHLDKENIQKDLDTAKAIFEEKNLKETVEINTNITASKDGKLGFGGSNSWQPLGVSAGAGETVVVYVGSNKGKTGDNTDLTLVYSQYHAESSSFVRESQKLKVGRNEISLNRLQTIDVESGGSLYIAYKGNNQNDRYSSYQRWSENSCFKSLPGGGCTGTSQTYRKVCDRAGRSSGKSGKKYIKRSIKIVTMPL